MKTPIKSDVCMSLLSLAIVFWFCASGCVSQRYVDDLETLYRRSQEQMLDLKAHLKEKETEIEVLKTTLGGQNPEMLEKLKKALSSHEKLTRALAKAESRLRLVGTGPVLDPELDAALIELSKSNPDLMTYESQMGMVRFHSDLTFSLGSTEVSGGAISSLEKLADILKSSVGKSYTARIVGHTDNVPIGRPSTRAKHPTNWHLSVHRAIAVKDTLARFGVGVSRMGVAGYGEHRPIAPNGSKGNKANRRVEIYLLRYAPADSVDAPSSLGITSGLETIEEAPATGQIKKSGRDDRSKSRAPEEPVK